jgi:light-regulated signal transduction histidine kinase (bacteriophytochrome)
MFLEHVLPEDRADVDRAFTEATTKQSDWNFECRIRRVDGELRWIRAAGRHERNAESKPVRMSGIVQDITERKSAEEGIRKLNVELEQRVRARTAELEATNAELEAFAYSVSHDLRAPLRAIAGFSRILVDDYGPQLDDEGRRVCSVIDDNARNMSQLIDDLLAFSRLGRTQMQPSLIDMQGMARAVFHEVTTPEQRSRIDFELPTIPQVIGDPSLMRQVWANLLGNAVKFSSRRERAAITIRSETKEGEYVFSIGDNGAGFDMQYVNKLFGVFQRLHSSKQFEGTGVGLALVQRVIRRHGGRVWAQGEPDRGATFHFALPLKGP